MYKIRLACAAVLVVFVIAAPLSAVTELTIIVPAHADSAATCSDGSLAPGGDTSKCPTFCDPGGAGAGCDAGLHQVAASHSQLYDILRILFGVLGVIAVLVIVLAGLRFTTTQGNPNETARARNAIIYASVGLLVALAAEAMVSLVLGQLGPSS